MGKIDTFVFALNLLVIVEAPNPVNLLRTSFTNFQSALHLHSIDLLRGVAALSVVIYHLVHERPERFDQLPWLQSLSSFGHFGVQIFFVISGFVIPYSMYRAGYRFRNFGKFMLKRLIRLEPPYLISVLICLAVAYIQVLSPNYRGEPPAFSWQQIVLHVAYVNTYFHYEWLNSVYWTLAIEFQYYILAGLLIYPAIMTGKPGIIVVWLTGTVLAFIIPDHTLFFIHFPFFFLGITLFLLKSQRLSFMECLLLVMLTTGVIAYNHDYLHVLCGLGTMMMIMVYSGKAKVWIFFGGISYSLYLLHDPIGQPIMSLSENFITNDWIMFVALVVVVIIIVFVSWLYMIYIEAPSHALSKRIRY